MLASHRDWWLSLDGWWALWAAASAHDSSPGHAPSGFDRWLRRINPMFSRCSSKMQTAWSLNTFGKEGWKKHHKTKGFETSQITPASLYGVSWSCKEEKNLKTCLRKMQKALALQSLISGSPKSGDVEFLQILNSPLFIKGMLAGLKNRVCLCQNTTSGTTAGLHDRPYYWR